MFSMAPIATPSGPQPVTTYAKGTADYKEAGGGLRDYNPALEEEGEEKAHVDVLMLYLMNVGSKFHSIRTISQLGTLTKNTLL